MQLNVPGVEEAVSGHFPTPTDVAGTLPQPRGPHHGRALYIGVTVLIRHGTKFFFYRE